MYLKILFILVLISNTMYAKSSWVPIFVSDIGIFVPNSQINKPLSVSNIHPMNITKNSAKIFWDVSSYATGQVEYGETTAYGYLNKKETSFDYDSHGQSLKNLKAGTTYHYRVISEDTNGQKVVSNDYTFTTKAIPITVSNIHPMNITKNSAKIFWDVSSYATGQVEYGETTAYGYLNKKETSFDYDSHGQSLKNLKAGTTYHYRVISEDAAGNKIVSEDYTFTTLGNTGKKKLILHAHSGGWAPMMAPNLIQRHKEINALPFSGYGVVGNSFTNRIMKKNIVVTYDNVWDELKGLKGLYVNKSNFLVVDMHFPGDLWDDAAWDKVTNNFKTLAKVVKNLGFSGIIYDNEAYHRSHWEDKKHQKIVCLDDSGLKLINYDKDNDFFDYFSNKRECKEAHKNNNYTFLEHTSKISERFKNIMQGMVSEFSAIDVLYYHSAAEGHIAADHAGKNGRRPLITGVGREGGQELVGAMILGLKQGLSGDASLHDMGEDYTLTKKEHFERAYQWRKHTIASDAINDGIDPTEHWTVPKNDRKSWAKDDNCGFMVTNFAKSDPDPEFDTRDKVDLNNMKNTIMNSLDRSDEYVIFYSASLTSDSKDYTGVGKIKLDWLQDPTKVAGDGTHFGVHPDWMNMMKDVYNSIKGNDHIHYGELGAYANKVHRINPADGKIYYLKDTPNLPTIAFLGGLSNGNDGLCQYIASWGYNVIATEWPWGKSEASILSHMKKLLTEVHDTYHADITKLGMIGHSYAGGSAFNVMKELKSQAIAGNTKSALISLDGTFPFGMKQTDMHNFDTPTLLIQYGGADGLDKGYAGTGNYDYYQDPNINRTIFNELQNVETKSFIFIEADNTHGYNAGNKEAMIEKKELLKPMHLFLNHTLKNIPAIYDTLDQTNDVIRKDKSKYHYACDDPDVSHFEFCNLDNPIYK